MATVCRLKRPLGEGSVSGVLLFLGIRMSLNEGAKAGQLRRSNRLPHIHRDIDQVLFRVEDRSTAEANLLANRGNARDISREEIDRPSVVSLQDSTPDPDGIPEGAASPSGLVLQCLDCSGVALPSGLTLGLRITFERVTLTILFYPRSPICLSSCFGYEGFHFAFIERDLGAPVVALAILGLHDASGQLVVSLLGNLLLDDSEQRLAVGQIVQTKVRVLRRVLAHCFWRWIPPQAIARGRPSVMATLSEAVIDPPNEP